MNSQTACSDPLEASRRQIDEMLCSIRASASSIVDSMSCGVVHNSKVLRTIATMLEDGLVLLDKNRRITIFNPSASSIFGINAEDAIGKTFDQLFPELADKLSEDQVMRDVHTLTSKCKTAKVDVWSANMTSPRANEFTPFGVVLARRHVLSDADELARKLDEALDLYSMTVWNIPVVMFVSDKDGRNIRGSEDFYALFGRSPDSVEDVGVDSLLHPVDWFHTSARKAQAITRISTVDGFRNMVAQRNAVVSSDGENRILGYITCLTEAPQPCTEVAFASTFVKALDALPTPMMMLTYREGRILIVNKAFCTKYGYERSNLMNRGVSSLLVGEYVRSRRLIAKALADGKEPVDTFTMQDANGRAVRLATKAISISPEGSTGSLPKYCLLSEC